MPSTHGRRYGNARGDGLKTLDQMQCGEGGVVERVESASNELLVRLLSLGLVRGVAVKVVRIAPLGDPIAVSVLSSVVSLRLVEAAAITVTNETTVSSPVL